MAEPEVQLAALKSWASIAAHGLADTLRPEVAQAIEIGSTEVDVLAHDVLSAALPDEGLGTYCNVKDGATDLPIVIFEKDAALAVIASRRDELAALPARRADKRALDEDERLALAVVGTVIADGFQALVQKLFPNATVTTMGAGVIAEGNWGDATPAFSMDVGRVELVLRWGDGDSAAARILVAGPLLEKTTASPVAAAKVAEVMVDPRAARSDAVLALTEDAALVEKIKAAVAPVGVTPIGDVTDFLRQWKSGAALGAVACVRAGDEGMLPLLGGMHRLPGVNDRPFFVVLEKPTIEAVVLCGRAEIYDVLPNDFTADDLKGRWPARKA